MLKPLYEDPVVAEVHALRKKMLEECGGDLRLMLQRIREQQDASGRPVRDAPTDDTGHNNGLNRSDN